MATTSGDSDSDYGWDLSPEDEQKLAALDAHLPPPSTPSSGLTSTARLSRQLGSTGYSLEADVNAAFKNGKRVASGEPIRALYDEKDHRDLADVDPGFVYRHEARIVSRNAAGMAAMVTSDGGIHRAGVLDEKPTRSSPLPAADDDVSYPDCTSLPWLLPVA